jgi:methionine synthase / methylenetetrahydrofolate reductase(NADPH)
MGTMLYSRGVYINRCYDELNLRDPDLVREVHRAYVRAGAEMIETNSYGANPLKLARTGSRRRCGRSTRGRRRSRGGGGGASAWPGRWGRWGAHRAVRPHLDGGGTGLFREQAEALLAGGVDLFILETFSDLLEMQQAVLGGPLAVRPADRRADGDPGGRPHAARHRGGRSSRSG